SKKALLYQTRKPAQARRELDPRVQDFLALRQKKNRKKAPAPEASELSETKMQLHQKSDYIFVKNRKAFKLSTEIRNQYPDGFVHLGFWVAKDESFLVDKVGLDVVYNPRHKTYGVVTGVLKVKMQDMRDQSDFSVSTGGEIFKSYDYILASLFKYQ